VRNAILALTNSEDGMHSDVVVSKLLARGEDVFRFDVDLFTKGNFTIAFSPSADSGGCVISNGSDSIQVGDIKSVWYRRPNHFNLPIKDPVQKDYAEKEIRSFLDAVWFLLEQRERIFFLSRPSAIESARRKLFQLDLAERYGMRIPRTIITNDPEKVRTFQRSCPEGMIFKAVNHEFLNYGEKSYNIPTTLITADHLRKIDLVRRSPAIFQELIVKDYELRVTVVGKKVFPIKIDSQKNPWTIVDWRNPLCIGKLDYSVTDLDPRIELFCLEMLRTLGLQFGAFDFVVDKDGSLYFLEVNPNGQWYWLEDLTGVLISDAIVDILMTA
jgi:glutathione synthase/RimK-type ligase-like ATP-grasp enzyme